MDFQEAKQRTENDFKYSLEWYKVMVDELNSLDKQLFQLKVGAGGFIVVMFTIVFSGTISSIAFSNFTRYGLLIIMGCAILLLTEEIWKTAKERISNLMSQKRNSMLLKLRYYATKDPDRYKNYGIEAEKKYFEADPMFKEMEAGRGLDEIIKEREPKIHYKLHLILWSALPLTLLFLFLFEILL